MNKYYLIAALFAFALFAQTALGQADPVIDQIIQLGKTDNQTMDHLDILSNRFGGRLIGSDAYENAAEWAAYEFHKWGMKVEMDETGELPIGFNRGPWFGKMLDTDGMHLHFTTPSYTAGTKGKQRGHVVMEPKTQREFDRMKGKLNGAWVLISGSNTGFPIDISEDADKYRDSLIADNLLISEMNSEIGKTNRKAKKEKDKKEEQKLNDVPAIFYRQMVDAGILGIIQCASLPIKAMYDRKNVNNMTWENLPSTPDIKLDEHQYKIIEQKVKERQEVWLEFDIRNHFKMGPVRYHNVIGIIEGTEFPDEYVIMSAHLDAYDVATGGVDDGSGVCVMMEAARLIMKAGGKPKRTILVTLWAGEEFGLLGSSSWIGRNPEKLEKISNMFNKDGGPTVPSHISVSDAMWKDMEQVCTPINAINPDFPFEMRKREARNRPERAWGTDSGPFAVAGVPTMSIRRSDPKGYDFDYYEIWHTERDLYNKSIPEYQNHASIVYAIMVYGVANLDHLLSKEGYYLD
jgi:hypothetical protein